MFPLVHETSRALQVGKVGLEDCSRYICDGELIQSPGFPRDRQLFSRQFQWLPSDVEFSPGNKVHISSYINNLHPKKHGGLYSVIEQFIAKVIPVWDRALSQIDHVGQRLKHDWITGTLLSPPESEQFEIATPWNFRSRSLTVDLRREFQLTGLQVIVKLSNIELSPAKPRYDGWTWHIEATLNERICASAIYCYAAENITASHLHFRQRTETTNARYNIDQVRVSVR